MNLLEVLFGICRLSHLSPRSPTHALISVYSRAKGCINGAQENLLYVSGGIQDGTGRSLCEYHALYERVLELQRIYAVLVYFLTQAG